MKDERRGTAGRVRPVAELSEMVLPQDANPLGNILGGRVMHLVDIACAMAAMRHCRRPVVTVAMDRMFFRHPIKVGDLVIVQASLNRAFKSSMEVGARVMAENLATGERRHTSSAYLTFVALDASGLPMPVRGFAPRTPEEVRRHRHAGIRRKLRLLEREKLKRG